MKNNLKNVVIFGRTNVGKSTLFNKLTEKNQALVSGLEGTTRDINMETVSWQGFDFLLTDTGGIIEMKKFLAKKDPKDDIDTRVQKIAKEVMDKADLILFLVDQKVGILPDDRKIARYLNDNFSKDKIVLVVNKADTIADKREASQFIKLAIGEPIPISANSGSGSGDLLDEIVDRLKKNFLLGRGGAEDDGVGINVADPNTIRIAMIGQPNTGKSSLINKILGYERVIVSPTPKTTREPQDIEFEFGEKKIILVDTAGLTKKGRANLNKKLLTKRITNPETLDRLSVHKSFAALNKSDIVLFMLDISQEITMEDAKIIEEIKNRKKSLIIVANKWDLIEDRDTKDFTRYIRNVLPFIKWAPIQFLSAKTGEKVNKLMDTVLKVNAERHKEITEKEAERFLLRVIKIIRPMKGRGQVHPRIYKFKQIKTNPPQFECRIGTKEDLSPSYLSFLENRLRERYGFDGTPIGIRVIRRQQQSEEEKALEKLRKKKSARGGPALGGK